MKEINEDNEPQQQMQTIEQKQRQKKMLIYPLMFIIFVLCIWFIFSPSKSDKKNVIDRKGFNTTIPKPQRKELVGDKKTAYEQAKLEEANSERMRSLKEMVSMLGEKTKNISDLETKNRDDYEIALNQNLRNSLGNRQPKTIIESSHDAYRNIHKNLSNFFVTPKQNPTSETINQKTEELSAPLSDAENRKNSLEAQIQLLEKSYQMAAKYIPQVQQMAGQNNQPSNRANTARKEKIFRVNQVMDQPVSTLSQVFNDSIQIAYSKQPLNKGFNTAVGRPLEEDRNTIKACVYRDCSLSNGKSVRLRLLEPIQTGRIQIPRGNMISGEVKIQGDRLNISIQSLEYRGMIVPVELTVYDTDGQEGIFIPGSLEINALKEMAAGIGSNMGTSVSFSQSAGQQLVSELGKGILQSSSQYLSKKFQTVTVKLKAGYQVLLYIKPE